MPFCLAVVLCDFTNDSYRQCAFIRAGICSEQEIIHEEAFACLKEFVSHTSIDIELRHANVKPILQNVRQTTHLRLNTARQLSYCAQLFPSTFSERLCDAIYVSCTTRISCFKFGRLWRKNLNQKLTSRPGRSFIWIRYYKEHCPSSSFSPLCRKICFLKWLYLRLVPPAYIYIQTVSCLILNAWNILYILVRTQVVFTSVAIMPDLLENCHLKLLQITPSLVSWTLELYDILLLLPIFIEHTVRRTRFLILEQMRRLLVHVQANVKSFSYFLISVTSDRTGG